jgi:ribosome-associated protein
MVNPENLEQKATVPESEIDISYTFSSGPGGQNVNKRETKAVLRWRVEDSAIFNDEEKARIMEALANRISKEGVLIISSQKERTQLRNKEIALRRLGQLVNNALTLEEKRIPTKPTKASQKRRVDDKKRIGQKKASRQKPNIVDWN